MKVVDLKTMVVENEPPSRGGRCLLILELKTDEGIVGLGERITGNTYSRNLANLKPQINLIEEMGRQCGRILEAKKIAAIAEAHYAMIAPHMARGPIAAAAAIQIDTCSPNFLIQEANLEPLHGTIFKEPLTFENGYITPPTGPGLGVEFDEDVLKQHLVEQVRPDGHQLFMFHRQSPC